MDANGANKVQLTFGTHDEGGAQFLDPNTLVFASTAVNPAEPIDPEVAKNGQIYNIWTLDLKTNELKQFTDALVRHSPPVVLRDRPVNRLAFVTYFKGDTACTCSSARTRSPAWRRPTSARRVRSSTSRRR